jgi:hypothetical protein
MNREGIQDYPSYYGASFEEFLSYILCAFGGVKTLTLVAKHVGYYPGPKQFLNQLSLLDPIDTDILEVHHCYAYDLGERSRKQMQIIHGIPELDIDWIQVDLAELQRLSEEVTEERQTSWAVPKIEYKIMIPDSYQPFLDWIEEKRLETVEWEAEQKEHRRARRLAREWNLSLLSQLPFCGTNRER